MEKLISEVVWQAAADRAGMPVNGRNWSMESYNKTCDIYDNIIKNSYAAVAVAVTAAVAVAAAG